MQGWREEQSFRNAKGQHVHFGVWILDEAARGLGLRQANGLFAMLGSREEMEDAHLALPDFDPERGLSLFGVFDGHGGGPVLAGTSCRPSGVRRKY